MQFAIIPPQSVARYSNDYTLYKDFDCSEKNLFFIFLFRFHFYI